MAGHSLHTARTTDAAWIAERARTLGFDLCGIVRPEKFPELSRTEEWLARGYAGEMQYLKDARRADPTTAMSGVRSVIVCALNYNAPAPRSLDVLESDSAKGHGWISRYAWGDDYHEVLQQKLNALAAALPERFRETFEARIYADTGPVNERVLAKHAGLGWIAKNTLLLSRELGSWFFLGVILTTLDLPSTLAAHETPAADLCGSCTKCIEACPTGALLKPYVMDSRRCISYLTIEFRGSIPEELREPIGQHVFGCDICQDVCPWNRRAVATTAPAFRPRSFPKLLKGGESSATTQENRGVGNPPGEESLFLPRLEWLVSLSEEQFRNYFRGSPIKRTKWRGLIRNACIALGNSCEPSKSARQRITVLLAQLAKSAEPVISESAQWALSRIQ